LTQRPEKTASSFDELDLSPAMMEALRLAGYEKPTPVQAGVIPLALDGADVIAQARTGTGKTASFAIPILEELEPAREVPGVQALVMVPTRELAVQVRDEFVKLAHGQRVHCVAIYGGKPFREQAEKLRRGVQVVVGTPGRILDHMSRGTLKFHQLWWVVLDEADRMLDIGFRPDIERVLRRCPTDRQTLLLSATVPPPIQRLAQKYMHQPETLDFSPLDVSVETIEQFYFTVDHDRKYDLLVQLLKHEQPRQAIIFCRTKRGTERLYQKLEKKFPDVACIHGDLQQRERDRVMASFRRAELKVLVATDVVGRGIDVTGVSHIINFDIPEFCDDYVHRVGRTGRMGREGVAITFVSPEEGPQLTRIEERINRLLKRSHLEGFEHSVPAAPSEPNNVQPAPPPPSELSRRPVKRYRRAL
jgi:ATP-dependent RNA helicase DeaD